MAQRPSLTGDSFLKHLFTPKKNALPVGIRKRKLVSDKGRVKGRLAAYNRMSAASQEILRQAGTREAYLRGEASLKDSRTILRSRAVSKGFAKPLRGKAGPQRTRTALDTAVAVHVIHELRQQGYTPNVNRLHANTPFLPDDIKQQASHWSSAQIRAYAGDADNVIEADGLTFNPLWYR